MRVCCAQRKYVSEEENVNSLSFSAVNAKFPDKKRNMHLLCLGDGGCKLKARSRMA